MYVHVCESNVRKTHNSQLIYMYMYMYVDKTNL
jgi:hypothetical protein